MFKLKNKKITTFKDLSEYLKDSKMMSLSEFIYGKLNNLVYVRSHYRHKPVKK